MSITVWELIVLMGVPSAITGFAIWGLKRWLEKKEKRADERNKALTDILIAQIMCNNAGLSLSEAIANAVSRIPEAHCNGDMHSALDVARQMKREQRELLTKLGVASVVD